MRLLRGFTSFDSSGYSIIPHSQNGRTTISQSPILNLAELAFKPSPIPVPEALNDRYGGARLAPIGLRLGAQKLGYNVTALPPGKRAFPLHNHRVNEEMFFILEGEGEIRIGATRRPVRRGDFI